MGSPFDVPVEHRAEARRGHEKRRPSPEGDWRQRCLKRVVARSCRERELGVEPFDYRIMTAALCNAI
jgi:hypothetical protein